MAFLRVKKIKGKEYCYLVENRWKRRKGARQRVKGYLGAVVRLSGKEIDFFKFYDISDPDEFFKRKKALDVVKDVVIWELAKAGFKEKGKMLVFDKEGIIFDKGKLKAFRNGNNVVLKMNEGHLCDFTLKKILSFEKSGDIEEDSVELARVFVDAGLNVPKEAFIAYFEKVK